DGPDLDLGLGDNIFICEGGSTVLDATPTNIDDLPDGVTYTWYKDGELISGETGATLVVTEPGLYSVEVTSNGSACTGEAEVEVDISTPPEFDLGEDFSVTDLDGVVLDATPTNMDPDGLTFEWYYNGDPIPEDGPIV